MQVPDIATLPPDAVLTIKQLANLTGFAPLTVKGWRKRNRGPKFITLNGRPRYRVEDVRQWMNLGRSADERCLP